MEWVVHMGCYSIQVVATGHWSCLLLGLKCFLGAQLYKQLKLRCYCETTNSLTIPILEY